MISYTELDEEWGQVTSVVQISSENPNESGFSLSYMDWRNNRGEAKLLVDLVGIEPTTSPASRGALKLARERSISCLVDLVGIEPTTSSMPWERAPSCATGPLLQMIHSRAVTTVPSNRTRACAHSFGSSFGSGAPIPYGQCLHPLPQQ